MSTHKHIDRICAIVLVLTLLLTVVFLNGQALGLQPAGSVMGYEARLFDTARVHTIDIVIDDWDAFLQTAQSETYSVCDLVIDGEAYQNVGIRGKGNTSLSTVSSMNSERYSFKIEFDQYDTGKTYHGLDKLSLNNLIQDTTYMKDYLTYQMMQAFGAAAPLCSYVQITVNGEPWGLYLAVEGVEDSFLQRNYGTNYGELYKPDSMNFGGGRGNGMNFDMNDFMSSFSSKADTAQTEGQTASGEFNPSSFGGMELPEGFDPSSFGGMELPEGFDPSSFGGMELPEGFDPSSFGGMQLPEGFDPSSFGGMQMPEGFDPSSFGGMQMPEGFDPSSFGGMQMPEGFTEDAEETEESASENDTARPGSFDMGSMFGGFGMGSSDVKLQYVDDDPDSYSTIFDSAKTDLTAADKNRLIQALKTLSTTDQATDALDVDAVLRYFVVHNFVVNSDSYTGSMIHNYYLYEENGVLTMLPWDYNLAYGTFQGGDANGSVNDPIDTPLSVTGSGDRPMIDWIFASEETTTLYHQYFAKFLETVDAVSMIEETAALIAPYVEQDATAFYTYEAFETGVATLLEFCRLRTESVRGQLEGTIPTTSTEQRADSSSLIDASHLTLSAMGSMGGGMGGGFGGRDQDSSGQRPGSSGGMQMPEGFDPSSFGGMGGGFRTDSTSGATSTTQETTPGNSGTASGGRPDFSGRSFSREDFSGQFPSHFSGTASLISSLPTLLVSVAVLAVGLLVAFRFRRRG